MSVLSNASHRIASLPAALVRGYVRRQRENAASAALERMSDAELRDIGLDRADVRRAVNRGLPGRL
jgi:uncharacterized protein YjiS (DUF1127 family)